MRLRVIVSFVVLYFLEDFSMVKLETNFGVITIELDEVNTPKTAENFLNYVQNGFYDGIIFHRVIKGFMIQAGGFSSDMKNKSPDKSIMNEADKGAGNARGTVAMARTNDPHSAAAQFFINVADNDFLNHKSKTAEGWGYCVFGKVIEGMEVVDRISKVRTTAKAGHRDVPEDDVVILHAQMVAETVK
jgi:peptidyl-prolyl cis-trans isomerase B (cyclophilin B)